MLQPLESWGLKTGRTHHSGTRSGASATAQCIGRWTKHTAERANMSSTVQPKISRKATMLQDKLIGTRGVMRHVEACTLIRFRPSGRLLSEWQVRGHESQAPRPLWLSLLPGLSRAGGTRIHSPSLPFPFIFIFYTLLAIRAYFGRGVADRPGPYRMPRALLASVAVVP